MDAIVFSTKIKNGLIQIPKSYKGMQNTIAEIIVIDKKLEKHGPVSIRGLAGKIKLKMDPCKYQRKTRNEW